MARKVFSTGPTGSNRVSANAQQEIRYWSGELGCSAPKLQDAIASVGAQAADVRRYLAQQRRALVQAPAQQQAART